MNEKVEHNKSAEKENSGSFNRFISRTNSPQKFSPLKHSETDETISLVK